MCLLYFNQVGFFFRMREGSIAFIPIWLCSVTSPGWLQNTGFVDSCRQQEEHFWKRASVVPNFTPRKDKMFRSTFFAPKTFACEISFVAKCTKYLALHWNWPRYLRKKTAWLKQGGTFHWNGFVCCCCCKTQYLISVLPILTFVKYESTVSVFKIKIGVMSSRTKQMHSDLAVVDCG